MKNFTITLLAHATAHAIVLLLVYFAGVIITLDWGWLSQLGIIGRTFFLVLYIVAVVMSLQKNDDDE